MHTKNILRTKSKKTPKPPKQLKVKRTTKSQPPSFNRCIQSGIYRAVTVGVPDTWRMNEAALYRSMAATRTIKQPNRPDLILIIALINRLSVHSTMNLYRNTNVLLSVSIVWIISHCVHSVTVNTDKSSYSDILKDLDAKALYYLYQVSSDLCLLTALNEFDL